VVLKESIPYSQASGIDHTISDMNGEALPEALVSKEDVYCMMYLEGQQRKTYSIDSGKFLKIWHHSLKLH
jgi:hypothetical protein